MTTRKQRRIVTFGDGLDEVLSATVREARDAFLERHGGTPYPADLEGLHVEIVWTRGESRINYHASIDLSGMITEGDWDLPFAQLRIPGLGR